ncbi:MAG: DUF4387 family protein, partial [Desulfobacterales bacterium]|nr:DUF4387 family protein [Desulfobacterales bacterium]
FPEESFSAAMKLKLDLIAADAGSMDPGPYYLGTGTSYVERATLKKDFFMMMKGAMAQDCPLILGSCGMAGDTPNLMFMVDIAKEVFGELGVKNLKVALIDSHVPDEVLLGGVEDLVSLGRMGPVSERDIMECRKVAQMGIAPFIKALEEGARVILAGRSCDVAIFAADPIRRGMNVALSYHAGHILECGAIACDPGSASDCLIAEFTDDDRVVFFPPNPARKATTYSIAAHSLYEEDHPSLQFYPEGVLSLGKCNYFPAGDRSAGIQGSTFFKKPLTIKIEGSKKVGERVISVLPCREFNSIPEGYPVYGRNGVDADPAGETENEMGLIIKAKSKSEEIAKNLLGLWKGLFLHYGYEGRRSTAGNLAFPLSPSQVTYQDKDGTYVSFVVAGTRDPFFQEKFASIREEIGRRVQKDYPEMAGQGTVEISLGDRQAPWLYLETVAESREEASVRHREELERIEAFVDHGREALREIYAGECFEWGIYHLFTNGDAIQKRLFPVSLFSWNGSDLEPLKQVQPEYEPLGVEEWKEVNPDEVDALDPPKVGPKSSKKVRPLVEAARIIRSKNAGINKITYDVFFRSREEYRKALDSGCFVKEEMARLLRVPPDRIMGVFRADSCFAIKITLHREILSGSRGDRDLFGAQQHVRLMNMNIPV